MGVIKNFSSLATSQNRQIVLQLVEAAFSAIMPKTIMENNFLLIGSELKIQEKTYDISRFNRIFLIGFGKGSSGICKYIETTLGDRLTKGWDIDVVDETFEKISYTKGTHPLPSQTNVTFTENVLSELPQLTEQDLILVVVCGGGSVLFEAPTIPLARLTAMNTELLKSGATISEMNAIRKHVSKVKGGGLAERLFPARLISLLFSDVPGNEIAVIASGPTVKDPTTVTNAKAVIQKYHLQSVTENDLIEKKVDQKYFANVTNLIMVSNKTALEAMYEEAKKLGYHATIYTDRLQGDAKKIGKLLLSETRNKEILLAGGETTVHVTGNGTGGRNQTVVLAALPYLESTDIITAFGSDGWDFTTFAGAIGDNETLSKAKSLGLDVKTFLDNDNSTEFFQKTGDGLDTGKLQSNVSDLFIVAKL